MTKKILIIGSGPSALSACIRLLREENIQIYLLDGKDLLNIENSGCIYSLIHEGSQSRYKKLFKNNLDNSFKTTYKNAPKPSLQFGGYSTVWGGAINILEKEYEEYWSVLKKDINSLIPNFENIMEISSNSDKYLHYQTQELPIVEREKKLLGRLKKINNQKLSSDFSSIAMSTRIDTNICQECGEYIWSCRPYSAWSSNSLIKKLIETEKIIYLKNTSIYKIEENFTDGTCIVYTGKHKKYELEFNKVFVGAGAIGSSKIVLNSFEDISKIEIQTNDLISIPLINLSKKDKKLHTFTDLYIKYKDNKSNLFSQYYGYSENLLKLSENAIPLVKYIKNLLKPILRYSGGIFLYLDQNNSSSFVIEKEMGNLVIKGGRNPKKRNLLPSIFSFFLILLRARIICLPFGKWRKYGTSNHFGAQFSFSNEKIKHNKLNIASDSQGRIKKMKNVHFIDSSVLPVLAPGPITFIVMLNAYRITEEAINETKI
tara:strand:- start:3664 stop:5121 length:1458 start_codon:yes stop_codon:yes gene_type:complete